MHLTNGCILCLEDFEVLGSNMTTNSAACFSVHAVLAALGLTSIATRSQAIEAVCMFDVYALYTFTTV